MGGGEEVAGFLFSSMGPTGNWFTYLVQEAMRTDNTDDSLGYLVVQSLVCKRCEDHGGDAPRDCDHKDGEIPSWHASIKTAIARQLATGNHKALMQELKNFVGGGSGNVFAEKYVRSLFDPSTFVTRSSAECPAQIMLLVDPNANPDHENNSDTAVSVIARFNGALLVCGIALRNTRGTVAYNQLMADMDAAIRADPWLNKARVIVMCEKNTGMAAGTLQLNALSDHTRYYHPVLTGEEPGIRTLPGNKSSYAHMLNRNLAEGSIRMLKDFIVLPTEQERSARPDPNVYRTYLLSKIHDQMLTCRWKNGVNRRTGITTNAGWTGKTANSEDDGAVILAIGAEVNGKWDVDTRNAKGDIVKSYITGPMPQAVVTRWGTTIALAA